MQQITDKAYLRSDGKKGIRNLITVVYLVECAKHVAEKISQSFDDDVQVIGFRGCYPNTHASNVLTQICTHPNVGATLLVSLGCESFPRDILFDAVKSSNRPVELIVIQENGGTQKSIAKGCEYINAMRENLKNSPTCTMNIDELVVGTVCGGSDATSGLTANPAVGQFFDNFIALGGTGIFEETGELIGCEHIIKHRGITKEIGEAVEQSVIKARKFYSSLGHDSFAVGNATGGLSTIEEKSLGAYCKSGSCKIHGILKPAEQVPDKGLWLLDVIPDGKPTYGFPNVSDVSEIIEIASCGAHMVLYTSGRGSVAGSAIIPTIKICGNPVTYELLKDDIDINAGMALNGEKSLNEIAEDIMQVVLNTANGIKTKPESLGHQEFDLLYK